MDFEKKDNSPNISLYLIIACAVLGIGAVIAILLTRSTPTAKKEAKKIESEYSSFISSYNDDIEEAIDDVTPSVTSSEVLTEKPESAVPYTESNVIEAAPSDFVMPVNGNIIKNFSNSDLQYSKTFGDMRLHEGVDLACAEGSEVYAALDGTVSEVTETATLGRIVAIDHGNGITAKYCGLKSINVKVGEAVVAGYIIAKSGSVPGECEDEPHIHIEIIKNGEKISPLSLIKN